MVERTEAFSKFKSFLYQRTAWVLVVTGLDGIGKSRFLNDIATYSVDNGIALPFINFADDRLRQDPLSILESISISTANDCNQNTVKQFGQSLFKMRKQVINAITYNARIEETIIAIGATVTNVHMKVQIDTKEKVAKVTMHAYANVRSDLRTQLSTL